MSPDRALPNLPSSDFDATQRFYAGFGFRATFRDDGWMILQRGDVEIEFFPYPDVDPLTSSHRCTIRVDDLHELWGAIHAAGVPVVDTGRPRLHEPRVESSGLRIGYLVDTDGSQLALIQNEAQRHAAPASVATGREGA